MRLTYPPHLCNLTHVTIHIVRCLVIPPGPVAVLTRPTI
nr:MAG TPA: Chloramphenicol resistance gene leader peptide [Caudoviricetes sp.]